VTIRNIFLCLISVVLASSCTDLPSTTTSGAAAGTSPAATPAPTPENYGLYTDGDLQIYADTIDQRIQEALKSNNTAQAQELGRKRQELIAEFNRRGLKRHQAGPVVVHRYTRPSRPVNRPQPGDRPQTGGLPGED
jgi:hypothetical protein